MNWLRGPRLPFVGLSFAAVLGIVAADYFPLHPSIVLPAFAAVAVLGLGLLLWANNATIYFFVVCGFFVLHTLRTTDTPGSRLAQRFSNGPAAISVRGIVVTEPNVAATGTSSFLLKLSEIDTGAGPEPCTAELFVRWRGRPTFGDELNLFGVCTPVPPPRNPGEFDMRAYLARRDVQRTLIVRYPENGTILRHTRRNVIMQAAQKTRAWMQSALTRGLEDSPEVEAFLNGIVLGQRNDPQQEEIEEPFQQTGTLHLFAVAGLHVGIIGRLLWIGAMLAQLSRRTAAALIIPLLLFYSTITGLHVSSVRAAVMSSILLGAYFFDRRAYPLNSLAAAAFILLCIDTNEIFATGFQLSFAVVGAIVVLADPLGRTFRRLTAPDPFLPGALISRPKRWLHGGLDSMANGMAVSAAAWIGSFIPIWWYFHLVAPVSVLANLVVVPVAFAVLALAVLSIVATPVLASLALVLNNANWCLASIVIAAVHWFARIPDSHFYLARSFPRDPAMAHLTVLDVGAGAAVHFRTKEQDWLFDCGSERNYGRIVRPYLHAAGVNRIDGVVLSHGDSLHIGGVLHLLGEIPPHLIFDNIAPDRSHIHRQVQSALRTASVEARGALDGVTFSCGAGVNAEVMFPPAGFSAPAADNQAMVVRLRIGRTRVLLMSDSGEGTEQALIASGRDLHSDIIIKGQNHTAPSGGDDFLGAVQPKLVIVTSCPFPPSETVDGRWAERVQARGIKLFRQDEAGAVELQIFPNEWEARAYFTGEVLRSATR